ncbi:hypothetical protein SCP_0600430 [Sparassis crispa]|uniref:Protein-S-isoprenylcysteine O-methyltransferase n=1 Tax=Sparassis crispa TaxID=139825 RepID=A0A401GPB0_9APHY|nr:hypothetical protein SCP_0600430 [Sparassis crispa]GBE84065.1 hypothetical protein SCP_0600430 [Sparassis crispa]
MTSLQLLKLPLLCTAATCSQIAFTAPNPPAKAEEVKKFGRKDPGSYIGRLLLSTMKLLVWFATLCEIAVVIASHFPHPLSVQVLSVLVSAPPSFISNVRVTASSLLGWTLVCAGALLRVQCFRTLGRFFTFELSVKAEHKLVMNGPYAVVRHPSYAGTLMVASGNLLYFFGAGSWFAECGVWSTMMGKILALILIIGFGFPFVSVPLRIKKEDAVFRKEFGVQWEEWAKRTPYRVLPFVF